MPARLGQERRALVRGARRRLVAHRLDSPPAVLADAWQISAIGTKDYLTNDGIRVAPALRLLSELV